MQRSGRAERNQADIVRAKTKFGSLQLQPGSFPDPRVTTHLLPMEQSPNQPTELAKEGPTMAGALHPNQELSSSNLFLPIRQPAGSRWRTRGVKLLFEIP